VEDLRINSESNIQTAFENFGLGLFQWMKEWGRNKK
jgi:hypothetical protein